jgi:RHS repeat-associated protein
MLEDRVTPSVALQMQLPPSSTYGANNVLVINYTNTGTQAVPAPVLVVSADQANLWLPTDPAVSGTSLQVLGTGPSGPAGTLAPGASGSIVVDYTATSSSVSNINFSVSQLTPGQTINWASLQSSMQPSTMSAAGWSAVFANFTANVGSTTDSYQAALDADATYLAQVGKPTNDVSRLLAYEVARANAALSVPATTSSVDGSLPVPGKVSLSFARSFLPTVSGRNQVGTLGTGWTSNWSVTASADTQGDVTITAGGALRYFARQSNGSFLGTLGDHGALTAVTGGGYQLLESDGSLTAFNANGTLAYVQDSNGNRITASYSGGLLVQLTDSNGAYLVLGYTNGRLTRVTDSTGRVTTYSYDPTNQYLIGCTSELGTTTYSYVSGQGAASQNALASITFANGSHEYFSYDSQGRLIDEHQDGNQQDVQYSYPTGGIAATDAAGGTSSVLLDDAGNIVSATDGLGNLTRYTYDPSGDLTQVAGPLGSVWSYAYDTMGNRVSQTDPLGLTTTFIYDAGNRLTATTDANGHTTSYAYDSKNDLLSITYADGTTEVWKNYNPQGLAAQYVDANGHAIGFSYNAQGLMTQEAFADGSSYTFSYDARGNMLTATSAAGTITFLYQNSSTPDLLTEVLYPNKQYLKFSYNTIGQRTQSVDQTGFTTNYAYDTLGRLQKLTDGGGNLIVQYSYDAAGNLSAKDNGNGTRTAYTYDKEGRVLSITNLAPDHVTVNSFDNYTYDALGNVLGDTNQDGRWSYGYDADGQLKHAVFTPNSSNPDGLTSQDFTYVYDAAGNRVSGTVNGVTTTYVVNSVNEVTSSTTNGATTTYQYDNAGNLKSQSAAGSTTTYSYNLLDQLTGVSGPGLTASWTYDPLSHRNSQTVNGVTTQFLIDPAGLGDVASTYTGSGSLAAHYTYGLGLVSQVGATGSAAYYDFTLAGNTVGMTGTAGSYINKYSYLPFGQTTTITAALANPFTFVGHSGVMQDSPGLFNMRAREYSTATGQFLSNDPLGLNGGDTNVRRYVANNPVTLIDPSGLQAQLPYYAGTPSEFKDGNTIPDDLNIHGPFASYMIGGKGPPGGYNGYLQSGQDPTRYYAVQFHNDPNMGRVINFTSNQPLSPADFPPQMRKPQPANPYWDIDPHHYSWKPPPPELIGMLDALDVLIASISLPGATGTTDDTAPTSPSPVQSLTENFLSKVLVGNFIFGFPLPPVSDFTATTDFTSSTDPNYHGHAQDEIKQQSNGQYLVYAPISFPVSAIYYGTTHIQGDGETWIEDTPAIMVSDAPVIVNPVNYRAPSGRVVSTTVATFTDLDPGATTADRYAAWTVYSSTNIPQTIVPLGGNRYAVTASIDYNPNDYFTYQGWYFNGLMFSGVVGVWDANPRPLNPQGGADVADGITISDPGTAAWTTSVASLVPQVNGDEPFVGTLAYVDTTDPAITSADQVAATTTDADVTLTGTTLTRLANGITRIALKGIVTGAVSDQGPTVSPLTIHVGNETSLQANLGYTLTASSYTVNPVPVSATAGQALRNVQVATVAGPANGSYTATIDWGDGDTSPGQIVALGGDQFSVVGSKPHPYAATGNDTITVVVTGPGNVPAPPAETSAAVGPPPSLSLSTVTVASPTFPVGVTTTVTLAARDASGNPMGGGLAVTFALAGGSGGGTFGAVTDNGDGTYSATFTATKLGSSTIAATINGQALPTAPAITVVPAPTMISPLADQTIPVSGTTGALPFTVSSPWYAASQLVVSASFVPDAGSAGLLRGDDVLVAGSGSSRTVTITPEQGQRGGATITITVTDPQGAIARTSFHLLVDTGVSNGGANPLGDLNLVHTQGPYSDGFTVSNPDNATLSYSPPAVVTAAAVVQQRLGLLALMPDGSYDVNDTIIGAKWFQSTSGNDVIGDQAHQYYLMPSGELHFWDGNASDAGASTQVASLGAAVYADPALLLTALVAPTALSLESTYQFTSLLPNGGYATGDTIRNARWLKSTGGSDVPGDQMHQYYLLSSGELHFWDGSASDTGASTLVAVLVPAYYQDPQLLVHSVALSPPAGVTANYTATGIGGATLKIAGFAGLAGGFGVQLGINDGLRTLTTSFLVKVTDSAPTLALTGLTRPSSLNPIPTATTPHTGGVSGTFTSGDADGDTLTNSAHVVSQAYAVEEALALDPVFTGGTYDLNDTITGAKWFVSGNGSNSGAGMGQYYLLPDGTLHAWNGNASHTGASTLVASLGAGVYGDPTLLLTAPLAQAAYNAEQSLALTSLLPGNNFDTGDTIAGAQWYRSTNGHNAANGGQYFLLPDGTLHAWDGVTERLPDGTPITRSSSPLVAHLSPIYNDIPLLLVNAQAPAPLPAGLTANASPGSGSPFNATASGYSGFAGTFGVSVSVTDQVFTTTRDFLVAVTDSPPALAHINDQTVAHNSASSPQLTVAVSATDPDAADRPGLAYGAKVFSDALGAQAFQIQQQLALAALMPDGSYATGDTIAGARWLRSTSGNDVAGDQAHQYYLLPDGSLHFWDGSASDTGASTLVAKFTASYYSNPLLLLNPQQASVTVNAVGTGSSAMLDFNGFGPYAGTTLSAYAIASDGALTSAQLFRITVT